MPTPASPHRAPHFHPNPATAPGVIGLPPLNPQVKAGIRFLVVDDDRTLRESCSNLLQLDGYQVTAAGRGPEALELLRHRKFDIVLLDLYMSDVSGFDLLRAAIETSPDTIVIMMTGNPSVASSVEALRLGAWDYLPKPFSATHFQILVGRAVHTVSVAQESKQQQVEFAKEHGNSDRVQVLGISPVFRRAIELARRVAPTDASVFITGPSGSGKELIAQFIHAHSRRSSKPLVAVNCAALPEALLESEMFGHCKGAFTGAVRDKAGLLETANGGTLFLDELLEMSKPTQAKLLRVIQDGVVRRQRDYGRRRQRALHRRDQWRSRGGGQIGRAARGSVLPPARRPDLRPTPLAASGRHPAARQPLPELLLAGASGSQERRSQTRRERVARPAILFVARERARAAKRH